MRPMAQVRHDQKKKKQKDPEPWRGKGEDKQIGETVITGCRGDSWMSQG